MWNQILNLPVIVQGALGSFMFWLAFELSKRAISLAFSLLQKVNSHAKKELLTYKLLHHAQCFYDTGSNKEISAHTIAIFAATNRLIQAIIYICLGLVATIFIGDIAVISYLIAIVYLFLALQAVRVRWTWSEPTSKEEHRRKLESISKKLAQEKPNTVT